MAALIVLLMFAAGLFWANRIANRHDIGPLRRGKPPAPASSDVPADRVPARKWSTAWTALDDCQFRRLVDDTSPDNAGS